jgi:hypothetical protein
LVIFVVRLFCHRNLWFFHTCNDNGCSLKAHPGLACHSVLFLHGVLLSVGCSMECYVFFYATVLAQADAELLDELRRLEEQEKAILEDETATVTTEEDHDDRRQTIDSLDDA